jgi:F-box associated protein
MQPLSLELIDTIVAHVDSKDLARCASVSISFRNAVERRTFRSLSFLSTELDRFVEAFSEQRRRLLLKQITFKIVLPEYEERYFARFEREPDRKANNEVYTQAIKSLFEQLSSWEDGSGMTSSEISHSYFGISLEIQAYSPSDISHRPDPDMDRELQMTGTRSDLFEARYRRSFLRILDVDKIPAVQRISSFTVHTWNDRFEGVRYMEPASVAQLASQMPALERIDWNLPDDERWIKYAEARQERRYGKLNMRLHSFRPIH